MCEVRLCPVLLEMLRIRALALEDHEKRITLSFDGMTLKQLHMCKKHHDELCGFVDCGKYGQNATVAVRHLVDGAWLDTEMEANYWIFHCKAQFISYSSKSDNFWYNHSFKECWFHGRLYCYGSGIITMKMSRHHGCFNRKTMSGAQ